MPNEQMLLERVGDLNKWRLLWTDDNRDPYVANASAISDILTMIECGRMGELKRPQIKRLHFYMAQPGTEVRIVVDVLGLHFAYIVAKASIRLDVGGAA